MNHQILISTVKLKKTVARLAEQIPHDKPISIDFLGVKIPDAFVIGYGMDFDGQHRDLPFIAEMTSVGLF